MPFQLYPEEKAAKATEEYTQQLHELYKHECYGSKKKESCHSLAEFYMAVEKDLSKAKELFHYSCDELGFNDSCFALGNFYITQKKFQDPERALGLFVQACEKESSGACNNAGLLYQNGMKGSSIQKDMYKAIEMFEKSCSYGHRNGCFNLSTIYLLGKDGIEKDMPKALEFSLKSCHMMHPWACANVGRMYATGDGVNQNPHVADRYKRLAKKYSTQEIQL